MAKKHEKLIALVSAMFLLVCFTWVFGTLVGYSKIWPFNFVRDGYLMIQSLLHTGGIHPGGAWSKRPTIAGGKGRERIAIHDRQAVMPGFRAIMGYDSKSRNYTIWLFDETGVEHHAWPVDYTRIVLDAASSDSSGRMEPHGLAILPDGSVLVNFDEREALARLDSCGEPVWVTHGVYHHNIEVDEDGGLWTWRGEDTAYGYFQFIENIDAVTGNRIRSLDLQEIFEKNIPDAPLIFRVPAAYQFDPADKNPEAGLGLDVFHPNDVEPLRREHAEAFPQFAPGDLLVSFRNSDLVAVLEPRTGVVRWWRHGPWRRQHDPDFQEDGTITVFDNNPSLGRSSIIAVSPLTGKVEYKLVAGNLRFYSEWGGEHERLPNGNWLIVSSEEGRMVEVDASGSIVYEFNNILAEDYNAYILRGKWLPKGFFVRKPTCDQLTGLDASRE